MEITKEGEHRRPYEPSEEIRQVKEIGKNVGININLDQVHVNTNQSIFLLADTIYY